MTQWRTSKSAAAASHFPSNRGTALDVQCARKPMRLSNNKKKAKQDMIAKKKKNGGGGVDEGDGSLSPQQRVNRANHEARRWLGQHFLIDQSVILDAVAAADVKPGDKILEIGPGTGNLTAELLKAGASIVAVEKDRSLADKLVAQFENDEKHSIEIHNADFLKWDVAGEFGAPSVERDTMGDSGSTDRSTDTASGSSPQPDSRSKVVANIPYNITTDILKVLLPMGASFSNMVFMFQEEVAQRLLKDEPGQSDYRPMSVRVHYYSVPYYIRTVDASCFDPPPNVTSCLIGFRPRKPSEYLPLNGTEKQFFSFIQACFAQKRKMLKNNLKAVCDEETVVAAYAYLGKHEKTRAQDLSMPEYVKLFNFVRDAGQAKADVLSLSQPELSNGDSSKAKKPTVKQRAAAEKVERATSRLLEQARGDAKRAVEED